MKCPECLGERFEDGLFQLARIVDGEVALLRNVPAQRCIQCGYLIVDAETLARIDAALDAPASGTTIARVYDLAATDAKRVRAV